MVLFLRDSDNNSIVDTSFYIASSDVNDSKYLEINSVVIIDMYSKFLLDNLNRKDEIISDFAKLSDLRGWLWEVHFMGKRNTSDDYDTVLAILRDIFTNAANKYGLYYVED